jgi:lysozyme family protein
VAFDMFVNHGLATAVKILQRASCSVNKNHNTLLDDGVFGDQTLFVLNLIDQYYLCIATRAERAGYMRLIVANDDSQRVFLDGWLNRAYSV